MKITPNGYMTLFHANGNKMLEGEFKDGDKVGVFKYYDLNGNLVSEINYADDAVSGNINCYNDRGDITVIYNYDGGSIQGSVEFLNQVKVGEYSYVGEYDFIGDSKAPPINTLYHAFDDKHPSEIFPGTLWTFVENSFKVDESGNIKPVSIWLREPNISRGPFIYNGPFSEYRSNGTLFRQGTYVRDGKTSNIDGYLTTFRPDGRTMLFKGKYDNGVKIDKLEYYDSLNRIWKSVVIGSGTQLYLNGIYRVYDSFDNGDITYSFDKTNSAHLNILK